MTVSSEQPQTLAAEKSQQRAPDFFLVGHPKSGTTALYEALRPHPPISMPDLKKPSFLAPDYPRHFQRAGTGELPSTLEDYLALFLPARSDQRIGEASSAYLVSHVAARRLAELQPAAHTTAILRARF